MQMPMLIQKKRDGKSLTHEELEYFVDGVVSGRANDAQIGAMLMAIFLRGMDDAETVAFTGCMLASGKVLTWPEEWKGTMVDKHSTGGVGEKTSLVLTPALAACGLRVPMITGRGLGHTGGTLDKLEAIPGFDCNLTSGQMQEQLSTVGAFMVGSTNEMVPADKVLYALRDITATVDNRSLISASIMSKKLAESLDTLVLVIPFGVAGFMKTEDEARQLGHIMNVIGRGQGVCCSCLLMHMDDPIGMTIGNALEVRESVRCLNGEGPDDLHNIVCQIGSQILLLSGRVKTFDEGQAYMDRVIKNGSARQKFIDLLAEQGVDRILAEKMFSKDGQNVLPSSREITSVFAESTGYVHRIDAMDCAIFAHGLGAGRNRPEDDVNKAVGLELCVMVGDKLTKGEPWVKIHHDLTLTLRQMDLIKSAITITPQAPPPDRVERIVGFLD